VGVKAPRQAEEHHLLAAEELVRAERLRPLAGHHRELTFGHLIADLDRHCLCSPVA
jgi:hypothetical protein